MKTYAATIYVFDVDGVLCEIGSPTVDERVIGHIAGLLERGVYCAVNTGRGYGRVGTEFIAPLKQRYPNVSLDRLLVTTEMGGEVTHFDQQQPQTVYTKYALSSDMLKIFYEVWDAHKSELPAMYVYAGKKTMATTVRDYSYDQPIYAAQKALFENWLREAYTGTDVVIAGTQESTDVHAPEAGKNAGATNIIEWLARVSDIKHDTAICFGDSHSDYEMAREFAKSGFDTTFVYTGEALELADPHESVKLVDTAAVYTDGTVEYLATVA